MRDLVHPIDSKNTLKEFNVEYFQCFNESSVSVYV